MDNTGLLNSKETEMSVLGSIMYDPSLFTKALVSISSDDFFFPETANVYMAMEELSQAGLDINVKSVWNQLYKRNYSGITEDELSEMLMYRVDALAFISFVKQLAEFSGYRTLEMGLKKIDSAVKKKEGSLDEYCSMLGGLVKQVLAKDAKGGFATGAELVDSWVTMLTKERGTLGFTGIPSIDERLVDFDSKEISFIAARPGSGKTALMLQSARYNLEQGARVGFLSMEMSSSKLSNRIISSRARYNGEDLLRAGGAQALNNPEILEALAWLKTAPLFIDDQGPFTINGVSSTIRRMVYEHGVDVVYVDYIGLIKPSGGMSRNEHMTLASAELKSLSSELDIPIVIASQLSRDVVKRGSYRPNLADLRDSGSLEQDASIVAFLYPDVAELSSVGITDVDAYLKDESIVSVKFEVAKQRNGPVFTRDLVFEKFYGRMLLKEEAYASY